MSVKPFTQTFQDLTCQNVKYEVLLSMWNITQKLHPGLKPSNHKQLRKRHMCSAPKRDVHAVSKRYTLKFCAQLLHVHPETWLPRGLSFFFPLNIFGYTYSTYVYVHKCLVNLFIYLFILRLCFLTFILSLFQSIGDTGVCILCLSWPSTQRVLAWHCTTYYCCLHSCCLCRSFVTTELVSLGRRISVDTGCAGCRRVERTI